MDEHPGLYTYRVSDLIVVDGDTVYAEVDLGHNVLIREKYRLYGVNAPEIRTEAGKAAKQFVEEWLTGKQQLYLETIKYKTKEGERRGKYGRYLARVEDAEGECLNLALVENGHAELRVY